MGAQLESAETVNHEDGTAYKLEAKQELYLLATTALIENQTYRSKDEQLSRLRELVSIIDDQKFVLQLAYYVRRKMNLRSVAVALLAEATKLVSEYDVNGKSLLRVYAPKILARADEPLELLSYWLDNVGDGSKSKFPNGLKRGVADIFSNLDEYALGKYWRGVSRKAKVKPKDLLRICHLGNSPSEEIKRKAMMVYNDQIPVPQTWETYISENGASAESWNAIAPQMGIMALTRNLRNFITKGASEALEYAISQMQNADVVANSKMLPFRWLAAMREVERLVYDGPYDEIADTSTKIAVSHALYQKTIDSLNQAVDLSVKNIEGWKGRTAIFVDVSGSMQSPISRNSSITCCDIATLLGAIAAKLSSEGEYVVGAFADSYKPVVLKSSDSVITNAKAITNVSVGYSTNAWEAFRSLCESGEKYDRVILLSDMQCYNSRNYGGHNVDHYWRVYRKSNPTSRLYSVDLQGYGTSPVKTEDNSVCLIGGWSERIFDYMDSVEDVDAAITEIERQW